MKVITAVHAIECSSLCSLRCPYCVHPTMIAPNKNPERPAQHMSLPIFRRALEWVSHFVRAGTQTELNLTGIGETVDHPDFVEIVRLAREAVGSSVKVILPTNGVRLAGPEGTKIIADVAPYRPEIWVSLHRPEKGAIADKRLRAAGIVGQVSLDVATGSNNDWAGQIDPIWKGDYAIPCQWMLYGRAFVYSTGKIGHCCLDGSGSGAIGHVDDPIGSLALTGYQLCRSCYQEWGQSRV